ncbi:hypothetical protein [Aneurinibacillus aneurinilyticus]|jgi:hypothetical protein|uniref:Uncharacterized protein n=2 Tax=Aneurinibacillus aneurinilyticus TaxID=1391 RepID=A0A848CWJ1_ANEAE|nr:hypothetical protein [Aneurinibacillus aneurinilyticus]ERI08998.1 hypothetical protein HMPREF0083_02898 [Aneurinibacillus aneurinilyticus ATCC 12856]MCI1695776.1 hypothetical protein [Aneurinibacillus aneurinilyticus]MED0673620.1 hypothetical protein [Aneurinibacillus aneurinilyticus]MED0709569.1 hypothetical protein [Aneurinibacillus aneurinilyticus]MED0723417.1 hypothetical protein [Aneurinibacillus aneurinilyticus]
MCTTVLEKGKRKVGKGKETVETMNGIAETFSVIIVIAILLCVITTWFIFQKLRYVQSAAIDGQNKETGKTIK